MPHEITKDELKALLLKRGVSTTRRLLSDAYMHQTQDREEGKAALIDALLEFPCPLLTEVLNHKGWAFQVVEKEN